MSNVKEALEIFLKYGDDDMCAEHDEIYACHVPPKDMSPADVQRLTELNWHWSDVDSWRRFT